MQTPQRQKTIAVVLAALLVLPVTFLTAAGASNGNETPSVGTPNRRPMLLPRPAHLWTFRTGAGVAEQDRGAGPGLAEATISKESLRRTNSVALDGLSGSSVDFGPDVAQFGTGDFTLTFWMKTSAQTNLFDIIGNRSAPEDTNFFSVSMYGALPPGTTGKVIGELSEAVNGKNNLKVGDATSCKIDGKWHCYGIVREGRKFRLYVDGTKAAETAGKAQIADISTAAKFILGSGANPGVLTASFTDITIYYTTGSDTDMNQQFLLESGYVRE